MNELQVVPPVRDAAFRIPRNAATRAETAPGQSQDQVGLDYIPPLNANLQVLAPVRQPDAIKKQLGARGSLPTEFTWQNADDIDKFHGWRPNTQVIMMPVEQHACGSCWAIAAVTVLRDRFAIWQQDPSVPELSASYVLSCMPDTLKCGGGSSADAARFMASTGTVSHACWPNTWCTNSSECLHNQSGTSELSKKVPMCQSACIGSSTDPTLWSVESDASVQALTGIDAIKSEILENGPVVATFRVLTDFIPGKWPDNDGVYAHVPGESPKAEYIGNHAVSIVGWGSNYWIVRNSWGAQWGDGGFCKIAFTDPSRGVNVSLGLDTILHINDVAFGGALAFQPRTRRKATIYDTDGGSPEKLGLARNPWVLFGVSMILVLCIVGLARSRPLHARARVDK